VTELRNNRHLTMERLFDLITLRVIFGDRARCYRACQDQKQDRRPQWTRRDTHHQRGMHADLDPLHV